jgi:hypothetical protein
LRGARRTGGSKGQQPDLITDADTFRKIRSAHNHEVGHHGVERTILRMQRAFPRMRARVKHFVDACSFCQKMSRLSPALRVSRVMIDIIGTLASPRVIHSDQGAQFIGEPFDHMSAFKFSTLRSIATANSKEESAIVERANKEVNRHLRSLIYESALVRYASDGTADHELDATFRH